VPKFFWESANEYREGSTPTKKEEMYYDLQIVPWLKQGWLTFLLPKVLANLVIAYLDHPGTFLWKNYPSFHSKIARFQYDLWSRPPSSHRSWFSWFFSGLFQGE
jgi:hypothetical protein